MVAIEGPRSMTSANASTTYVANPNSPELVVAGTGQSADCRALVAADRAIEQAMLEFLLAALGFRSISGEEREFVHFVAAWGRRHGFRADLWEADEASLGAEHKKFARHIPLAGRPTLVLELPGDPDLPSLMFNAHSDMVAADADAWSHDPWAGTLIDGRVFGRGACDVKGPLTSALWAMMHLARRSERRGSILLELVPGEEDCVGLGTLTSVMRGWNADGLVVLEPTEQYPRCASRGGCRFEIEVLGRAVHGTVKWIGRDAIPAMCTTIGVLTELEADLNRTASSCDGQIHEGDPLFAAYPFLRPITVDAIHGGQWQGMVCDRCMCAGYFELLPDDDVRGWQQKFIGEVTARIAARGIRSDEVRVRFTEEYQGHRLAPNHALCGRAAKAISGCAGSAGFSWKGFNAGCEAGLRANRSQTPTLVWGPGSLAQAHAVDEYVEWADVRRVADMFTTFATLWTGNIDEI
ncbi:MAG TPA: M20/M25/M40 family metallo-hydrolase [Pirellulales bacterium]|jgi:acetylornithine deacetylase|nr:M20/M25/M40 family metallo-hydrolase [Pirellulales bacterium]